MGSSCTTWRSSSRATSAGPTRRTATAMSSSSRRRWSCASSGPSPGGWREARRPGPGRGAGNRRAASRRRRCGGAQRRRSGRARSRRARAVDDDHLVGHRSPADTDDAVTSSIASPGRPLEPGEARLDTFQRWLRSTSPSTRWRRSSTTVVRRRCPANRRQPADGATVAVPARRRRQRPHVHRGARRAGRRASVRSPSTCPATVAPAGWTASGAIGAMAAHVARARRAARADLGGAGRGGDGRSGGAGDRGHVAGVRLGRGRCAAVRRSTPAPDPAVLDQLRQVTAGPGPPPVRHHRLRPGHAP